MSNINSRSRVFIDALSSFWRRLFADQTTLEGLYQGVEDVLGQAYLDILESVLVRSIDTTPLFNKGSWRFMYLADTAKTTPPIGYTAAWLIPQYLSAKLIQNTILNPQIVYDQNDFTTWAVSDSQYGIAFKTDPSATNGIVKNLTGITLWATDTVIDMRNLYNAYGCLVGQDAPSTEQYRSLLKGVFQFYMMGPALTRIEAALNVLSEIPVVQTDGETVTAKTSDSVTTNVGTYSIPTGLVKSSITVGQVLDAFTPLSTAYSVVDYVSDPTWWWGITIPDYVVDTTPARKVASTGLAPFNYASDTTHYYGDPELAYGAHYTGLSTGSTAIAGLIHTFGYTIMNTLLKYHMFGVFPDPSIVNNPLSVTDLTSLIKSGIPSYTFVYVNS